MSVNLDEIRANLRKKALATIALLAADGDPKPSAVEQALLALGGEFDKELARAKAKLKLAKLEGEMPALHEALRLACVETEKAHAEKEAVALRHRAEVDAAELEYRDKWMRSNQAQMLTNKHEYAIRDLLAEVSQP